MTDRTTGGCDRDRLGALLDERLDPGEEREALAHLDRCGECRSELDALAGDPGQWRTLRRDLEQTARTSAPARSTIDLELEQILERLGPTDDPQMLGRLGRYEICGVVGRGSTGVVFKALDPSLSRFVAVKVLLPSYGINGSARARFDREGRAIAAVSHEHVIPVHEVDEYDGLPYLVMPYVPGGSLQHRLQTEGPLDNDAVIRVGMQVAKGLAAAHAQGIVHRDVKPANVLLEGSDRAMVTDFGLARVADDASMTRSGVVAGTPQYMSPEQARGDAVGPPSDLFSLGSVLYAACTGRPPFRAETVYGVIYKVCEASPRSIREVNPEIEPWLASFVERLMSKDVSKRFLSAAEVGALLELELAHRQNPTFVSAPPRPWHDEPPARLRLRPIVIAVALALVAAVSFAGFGGFSGFGDGWRLFGTPGDDGGDRAGGAGRDGSGLERAGLLPSIAGLPDGDDVESLKKPKDRQEATTANDPESGAVERSSAASERASRALPETLGVPGKLITVEGEYTGGVIDGYELYLPRSYGSGNQSYPMILFLSGGCGVGGEVRDLRRWGLPRLIADRSKKSRRKMTELERYLLDTFIVVAPHMIDGSYDDRQFYDEPVAIEEILGEVGLAYRVDHDRVYLNGGGRGGHGTWGLASRMPDRFAAIAPIRGVADGIVDWEALVSLPIFTGHNVDDESVDYQETVSTVEHLESLGGPDFLRLDDMESVAGNSSTRVFVSVPKSTRCDWPDVWAAAEFYRWLLRFKRGESESV